MGGFNHTVGNLLSDAAWFKENCVPVKSRRMQPSPTVASTSAFCFSESTREGKIQPVLIDSAPARALPAEVPR
jgi:hypothetical protein